MGQLTGLTDLLMPVYSPGPAGVIVFVLSLNLSVALPKNWKRGGLYLTFKDVVCLSIL